jgi:serine phosphatase RsbU (regulator of sigma subunit)
MASCDIITAVAKISKYAVSASGDTVEVIERPKGGISVVMADGQSSGRGAKTVSSFVVRKVIGLLAEGVRDGAAARAASDSLYTERGGKVSSTLNILSVDVQTQTLVITRNNPAPVLLAMNDEVTLLEDQCLPIGLYRDTRPVITEFPVQPGMTAVMYTDGLVHAGSRTGDKMDVRTILQSLLEAEDPPAQMIADSLLDHAYKLDQGRPVDDISVVVLRITNHQGSIIRRMSVNLPFGS